MSKTTEQRTVAEVNREEVKVAKESFDRYFFVNIPSLNDEFLKHVPMTTKQAKFKAALISTIESKSFDSRAQRKLYLGSFIKYLVEEQGYTISDAWRVVCDDDGCLGQYGNHGYKEHLADIYSVSYPNLDYNYSVGWLVLSE